MHQQRIAELMRERETVSIILKFTQHWPQAAQIRYDDTLVKSSTFCVMAEYHLTTLWRIAAPLQPVFDAVFDSLRWPEWWPGSEHVEEIDAGAPDGVGSVRRYDWKGRLPYRLSFDACATKLEPPWLLEATVKGDLEGIGRWVFLHGNGITSVQYEWHVRTTKGWMNMLPSATHRVLANNHHALMDAGAEALAQLLDARLVESRAITDAELIRRLPTLDR